MIRQTDFVVFRSRSVLANSFGEWMRAKVYVLPKETQGAPGTLANECIGPVPAFETLRTGRPNILSAASLTLWTIGASG